MLVHGYEYSPSQPCPCSQYSLPEDGNADDSIRWGILECGKRWLGLYKVDSLSTVKGTKLTGR